MRRYITNVLQTRFFLRAKLNECGGFDVEFDKLVNYLMQIKLDSKYKRSGCKNCLNAIFFFQKVTRSFTRNIVHVMYRESLFSHDDDVYNTPASFSY